MLTAGTGSQLSWCHHIDKHIYILAWYIHIQLFTGWFARHPSLSLSMFGATLRDRCGCWWFFWSPGAIGGDSTSLICLQCLFQVVNKSFITTASERGSYTEIRAQKSTGNYVSPPASPVAVAVTNILKLANREVDYFSNNLTLLICVWTIEFNTQLIFFVSHQNHVSYSLLTEGMIALKSEESWRVVRTKTKCWLGENTIFVSIKAQVHEHSHEICTPFHLWNTQIRSYTYILAT